MTALTWENLWEPALTAVQFALAVWLFASRVPLRPHVKARGVAVTALVVAIVLVGTAVGSQWNPSASTYPVFQQHLFPFLGVLALCVLVVRFMTEATWADALFIGCAGYAVQNLWSAVQGLFQFFGHWTGWYNGSLLYINIPSFVVTTTLVYWLAWRLWARNLTREGLNRVSAHGMATVLVMVVMFCLVLDCVQKSLALIGVDSFYVMMIHLSHIAGTLLTCLYAHSLLLRRRMEDEQLIRERLMADERRQFEQSRANAEALSRKAHDLKHWVGALRQGAGTVDTFLLDSLAVEVERYEDLYHTGNEAIDVVLSEKARVARRDSVTFSAIVDGAALDFMEPSDLYSFFGNALDNALEAQAQIPDPEQRRVRVDVRTRGSMACIHVDNPVLALPTFEDGLPHTTKGDETSHGFGTRSMREIAERYDGTLLLEAADGQFTLDLMLPMPE